MQFGLDNGDFNTNMIDGKKKFHYLGTIHIITQGSDVRTSKKTHKKI